MKFLTPPVSEIRTLLKGHIETIANIFFGDPTDLCGVMLRYRENRSLLVLTDTQEFKDFKAKKFGYAFDLVLLVHDGDFDIAHKWSVNFLTSNPEPPVPR